MLLTCLMRKTCACHQFMSLRGQYIIWTTLVFSFIHFSMEPTAKLFRVVPIAILWLFCCQNDKTRRLMYVTPFPAAFKKGTIKPHFFVSYFFANIEKKSYLLYDWILFMDHKWIINLKVRIWLTFISTVYSRHESAELKVVGN